MKKLSLLLFTNLIAVSLTFSQGAAINSSGAAADSTAILDVNSTSHGMLIPRMTIAQMNAIVNPANGLLVYNNDCGGFSYYNGTTWVPLGNVGNVPGAGAISGNPSPCANGSEVYSIATVSGAVSYTWTVPSDATIASGQGDTSVTVNFGTTDGNVCVFVTNQCGNSIPVCLPVTLQSSVAAPTEGTHSVQATQIIWNWNTAAGATGYKWNTVDDYNSATDMGSNTSKTETGLTCETVYTRYVWAYFSCGHSASVMLTDTTADCCTCSVTGFAYRKPVSVSNSTGGALTDFQVKLTVTYNSNMKSDFSDLRFRDTNCTALSYWIESFTASSTADVWIKIPAINTYGATIYMYYGNSGATSASDGFSTFCIFDDFESGTLSNWSTSSAGSPPYGVTTADKHGGTYSNYNGPSSCPANCWHSYQVDYSKSSLSLPAGDYYVSYWKHEPVDWGCTTDVFVNLVNLNYTECGGCNNYSNTGWYNYTNSFSSASTITDFMIEQHDLTNAETVYFDDIYVRKKALPEPSLNAGTEESGCP